MTAQAPPPVRGGANIFSPKLCFTLSIPGDWVPGGEAGTYLSRDGKQFVGVLAFSAKDLKRDKGNTLVEREASAVETAYNKELKGKLTDVKLAPFDLELERTWKWTAAFPGDPNHDGFHAPQRYLIDLSPDGVIVLNIQGTPNDDALAREIIKTVRTGKAPCQLPTNLESLLRKP